MWHSYSYNPENPSGMPKIFIQNMEKTVVVSKTARPLLFLLQDEFIDWMHACGGKGRCTTCKTIILEGEENVNLLTKAEEKYAKNGELLKNERLACQVLINGDVVIKVPEECKLPHLHYSD
jgi:ferredoxin, 2Fe-2S